MDSRIFNGIVIKLSCVKNMPFRENLPDVSSSVFNVTDVSFIELVSVGVPSVTPPDKGWEWGWDQRCHGESLRMSESLS